MALESQFEIHWTIWSWFSVSSPVFLQGSRPKISTAWLIWTNPLTVNSSCSYPPTSKSTVSFPCLLWSSTTVSPLLAFAISSPSLISNGLSSSKDRKSHWLYTDLSSPNFWVQSLQWLLPASMKGRRKYRNKYMTSSMPLRVSQNTIIKGNLVVNFYWSFRTNWGTGSKSSEQGCYTSDCLKLNIEQPYSQKSFSQSPPHLLLFYSGHTSFHVALAPFELSFLSSTCTLWHSHFVGIAPAKQRSCRHLTQAHPSHNWRATSTTRVNRQWILNTEMFLLQEKNCCQLLIQQFFLPVSYHYLALLKLL